MLFLQIVAGSFCGVWLFVLSVLAYMEITSRYERWMRFRQHSPFTLAYWFPKRA